MIKYSSNEVNDDYIMIKIRFNLDKAMFIDNVPDHIRQEINVIYMNMIDYEKNENSSIIKENVSIRKDSSLGSFILENDTIFYDIDNDITYDKIVNAYNISVFEKNVKMSNKILSLFLSRFSGTKEDLCDLVNEDVVNYIIEHSNFKIYLDGIDGVLDNKEYLVYEDGEFNRKKLSRKSKILSKCNS